MTKGQFIEIIQQKGRGKYIAILDKFVTETRATYGTKELYNLLIYEFSLTPAEIDIFSYWGFNGALKKYKKQLAKRKGAPSPSMPEPGPVVAKLNRTWQDADELAAGERLNKYKNL